jgi:methylmalonyl-CoA/ethylmalonyl-CoA epimerase
MIVQGLFFHHFGLATSGPDEGRTFLSHLGYSIAVPIFDPEQRVNLIWCVHERMPPVEIIFPADGVSTLDNILKGRDAHIYHVCYECSSIEQAVTSMKEIGLRIIQAAPPKQAILFSGRKVAFYLIKGFGLIELLEISAQASS